jgi:group I intron endonuclease
MKRTNYYQRKIVGLYLIQHRETLRSYCGQSRDVLHRWKSHCSGGKKAVGIGAAIRDEGVDSFIFRVLEECTVSQLNEREVWWIAHYDCVEPQGYNRNSGGGAPTYVSAATRKKLSAAHKGRALSPEHRAKTSAANKGKSLSPEHRAKIGAAHLGMTRSPEACANIGAAKKGKTRSPETIAAVVEGRRRGKAARSEAASLTDHTQKLLDTLKTDSTWTPMVEEAKPPAGPPSVAPPTLEELEALLQLL